jgi:hypothetical protein
MSYRRGRHHFLLEVSLAPNTLTMYKSAVLRFLNWCNIHHFDATNFRDLDLLLTDYFHSMYEENDGKGKGEATNCLYGLIRFLPIVKNNLPTAELSLKGWLKSQGSISYPPLSWSLTVCIAFKMFLSHEIKAGIGVLLAFHCLLRIGELTSLRRSDVALSNDPRLGINFNNMALRLRQTKTGSNQWVEITNKDVQVLVKVLLQRTVNDELLISMSSMQFRSLFRETCDSLGLSSKYVPHSLRHGGATLHHLDGHSIDDVLLRGRWSSTKSARRYIQSGRAMLLSMEAPNELIQSGNLLAGNLIQAFNLSLSQLH